MKTGLLQRFVEAMTSREVRKVMPTDMSSAELAELPVDVMEQAVTSAKTLSTTYLNAMEREVRAILEPTTATREDGSLFTAGRSEARAELSLQRVWRSLGYQPPEGKAGTIEDLASDQRVKLVIDTNRDMAHGYGQWRQGQSEDVLDLWPCLELFRLEQRKEPRDWNARWKEAAAEVGDRDALKALPRMIARKDSPIWEALSRFHTPYPPFDFNSGMWTREIDRDEAVKLGVIGEWDQVVPQRRPFESSSDEGRLAA